MNAQNPLPTTSVASSSPKQKKCSRWWVWLVVLMVLAGVFAVFSPLPNYWVARFRDTAEGYEHFTRSFPASSYVTDAASRASTMNDDKFWQTVSASGTADLLGRYLLIYPTGKHAEEAKTRHKRHADSAWKTLAQSRSENDLRAFVAEYAVSESPHVAEAQSRLRELLEDVGWVLEQKRTDVCQRFLDAHPDHPLAATVAKNIIDLEVGIIRGFSPRELIIPELVQTGGEIATITVGNQTGGRLVLRYSGADSKKQVIDPGKSDTVRLAPGNYEVTISGGDLYGHNNHYGKMYFGEGAYTLDLTTKITMVPVKKR